VVDGAEAIRGDDDNAAVESINQVEGCVST